MDEPIYLGFAGLESSRMLMFGTCYCKLQPFFREKSIQIHYIHTNSFVISISSFNIIRVLQNREDLLDFSNLSGNHEEFGKKRQKKE